MDHQKKQNGKSRSNDEWGQHQKDRRRKNREFEKRKKNRFFEDDEEWRPGKKGAFYEDDVEEDWKRV